METPKEMLEIARQVNAKYINDPQQAIKEWVSLVLELDESIASREVLAHLAGKQVIYQLRHSNNSTSKGSEPDEKHQLNGHSEPLRRSEPKVGIPGQDTASLAIFAVCDFVHGGKRAIDFLGEELLPAAAAEGRQMEGHRKVRDYFRWMHKEGVPEGKKASEVIPIMRLQAGYERIFQGREKTSSRNGHGGKSRKKVKS